MIILFHLVFILTSSHSVPVCKGFSNWRSFIQLLNKEDCTASYLMIFLNTDITLVLTGKPQHSYTYSQRWTIIKVWCRWCDIIESLIDYKDNALARAVCTTDWCSNTSRRRGKLFTIPENVFFSSVPHYQDTQFW